MYLYSSSTPDRIYSRALQMHANLVPRTASCMQQSTPPQAQSSAAGVNSQQQLVQRCISLWFEVVLVVQENLQSPNRLQQLTQTVTNTQSRGSKLQESQCRSPKICCWEWGIQLSIFQLVLWEVDLSATGSGCCSTHNQNRLIQSPEAALALRQATSPFNCWPRWAHTMQT